MVAPPLEEKKRKPRTNRDEIGRTFDWRFAHRKAWKKPREIALRRQERAEALGLTYEEYTLEVLERGYFPQEGPCRDDRRQAPGAPARWWCRRAVAERMRLKKP
jgi:hypothetical protein